MRRLVSVGLTASLIGGVLVSGVPARAASTERAEAPRFVAGQVLVSYRDRGPTALRALRRAHGLSVASRLPSLGVELVEVPDGTSVTEAVDALNSDPAVEYAEPNYVYSSNATPNDPGYPQQWALASGVIAAPDAWDVSVGSPEVRIGVIDTGVDLDHPDLVPNLWTNPGEVPNNLIDDDSNGYVDDVHGYDFAGLDSDPSDAQGHGTHVAGIAAARGNNATGVAGVSWNSRIVPLRALDDDGLGTTLELAQAFEYAGSMGFRLVNASLGGNGYSVTLERAVKDNPGTLFVVSSGNGDADGIGDDNDASPSYPCSFPQANILCVTATDQNDALATFANFGLTSVDLGAPGVDILSTLNGDGYATASGTSMATPFVTGAAALLWSLKPDASVADIKAALLEGADDSVALAGRTVTGGRLNVLKAMAVLSPELITEPGPDPQPTPEPDPEPEPEPTTGPNQDNPLASGVTVAKKGNKLTVEGWITPIQRGAATVKVVLKKKKGGRFHKVSSRRPLLDPGGDRSVYLVRFTRPGKGRCRIVATYTSGRTTRSKRTFNC